jgi:hypothetical protein
MYDTPDPRVWPTPMSQEAAAQFTRQHRQRAEQEQKRRDFLAQAPRPDAPVVPGPARTIDAGLQCLGERLALAWELLGSLEAHLDPVLARVPVQAHEWPLALEPTCALAQQILERLEQVQHLSARLSAVLERLAL